MLGSGLMSPGSSYIAGGGIISVSVCRVTFLDLLYMYTIAKFIKTVTKTPKNKVSTNVRDMDSVELCVQ